MTPRQAAEYRDEVARMKLADVEQKRSDTRAALDAAKAAKPTRKRKPRAKAQPATLPAKVDVMPPATPREASLVAVLLRHVCVDSVIDRERHALGVARMVLNAGVR